MTRLFFAPCHASHRDALSKRSCERTLPTAHRTHSSLHHLLIPLCVLAMLLVLPHRGAAAPPGTVGLVTSAGGLGDMGFTDQAYSALRLSQRRIPFSLVVQEASPDGSITDEEMTTIIARSDILFLLGHQYGPYVEKYAPRFPEKQFITIGGFTPPIPNAYAIHFRISEGAYLAGILAARSTRTHILGFIGGTRTQEILSCQQGFTAGIRSVNKDITILSRMVAPPETYSGFRNPRKAELLAQDLFAAGADIVLTMSGLSNMGVLKANRNQPRTRVILAGDKMGAMPHDNLLAVIERDVMTPVQHAMKILHSGARLYGYKELGIAENGIRLIPAPYNSVKIPDSVQTELAKAENDIRTGKLALPVPTHAHKKSDKPE